MCTDDEYDRAVGLLYAASVNDELWRTALTRVAETCGANIFHMFVWDHRINRPLLGTASHDYLFELLRLYDEYYHKVDPVLSQVLSRPIGQLVASQEMFDDRFINHNEYFQDFLVRNKFCWATAGMVDIGSRYSATIAFVRFWERGRFSDKELEVGRRLWTHFENAVRLFVHADEVRRAASLQSHIVDSWEIGVATIDDQGNVDFINRSAKAMVEASDRFVLRSRCLVAADSTIEGLWKGALRSVIEDWSCKSLSVPSFRKGGEDILMTLAPLRACSPTWFSVQKVSVLLLIRSRRRQRILTVQQLIHLFRLTPAEARLARALAHGCTPEQYASEAGLSMATIRKQLREVFSKTSTRGQVDLARLLVSIPSVRA